MLGAFLSLMGGLFAVQYESRTGAFTRWINALFNSGGKVVSIPAGQSFTQAELDAVARTIWGEARSEGRQGMQAVANVIMNRVASSRWPNDVIGVVKQPYQFSAWNFGDPNRAAMQSVTAADPAFRAALEIAEQALRGTLPDITGGANHYLNVELTKQIRGGRLPNWVDMADKTARVGKHTFLRA